MKKRLSILIAVCILAAGMTALPLSAGSNETKAYTDLDAQAWYYPGVAYMVTNGLMVGMSDASFEPETKLTRAMFVATLSRLSQEKPTEDAAVPFDDVPEDQWYYDHICWAYQNKVVAGLSSETFAPEENITREQMCLIMVNFAEHMGYELPSDGYMNIMNSFTVFSDEDEISEWASEAVEICATAGIVSGMGNGYFLPQGWTTRAQVCSMLRRFVRATTTKVDEGVADDTAKTCTYTYTDKFSAYATRTDALNDKGLVTKSEYTDDILFKSTTLYTYDEEGRCMSENYQDSTGDAYTAVHTYSEAGELISTSLSFDACQLILDAEGEMIGISFKLSDDGHLECYLEFYSDGSVKYEKLTDTSLETVQTFAYDEAGRVVKITYQQGETVYECAVNEFDENDLPTQMSIRANGQTADMTLLYNETANPIKLTVVSEELTAEILFEYQTSQFGPMLSKLIITTDQDLGAVLTIQEDSQTLKLTWQNGAWCLYEDILGDSIAYNDSDGSQKVLSSEEFIQDLSEKIDVDLASFFETAAFNKLYI